MHRIDQAMRQHRTKITLFLVFVVLQILDTALTTHMIAAVGSYEIEANPVMRFLLAATGSTHSLWIAKLVVILFIAALITRASNLVMWWGVALSAVVVANNTYILLAT